MANINMQDNTQNEYGKTPIPWFKNVKPHHDITQGLMDESVFAANLSEVAGGTGREIYNNAEFFFPKTFFTEGLKTISQRVIRALNGNQASENRVIALQTGFGGGKTHALISLFHLVKMGKKVSTANYTKDLVQYMDIPEFDHANVAVFTNNTNDPTQGRKVDNLHIKTIWGELAFQLGGIECYNIIRPNDENRTCPKGLFKKVLAKSTPCLILIDELADYCLAASAQKTGDSNLSDQTISFIQELTEAISHTDRCMLVATLPASVEEVGNSQEASQILTSLSNRLGRVGADTRPVADEEIYEVIRCRLFENIGDSDHIDHVISLYMKFYQELSSEVPHSATRSEYKQRMKKSYPFHPELIDMFRIRWASHHDFQRTRGVLRILASIVADIWKRQNNLMGINSLIHTSDVNFQVLDALSGQLKKLYGNGYDAVISADVSGPSSNAFKIDNEKPEYGNCNITQGISATILLGSFGSTSANKGLSIEELKLCCIKPDSFNHNIINGALDILESHAHYLYYSSTGSRSKRYWFHTKPNINILVNQTKSDIKPYETENEIRDRLSNNSRQIKQFKILVNPSPNNFPEQKSPTLIILGPEYAINSENIDKKIELHIENLSTKRGDAPRNYRNTILFLLCSEIGLSRLKIEVTEYLANTKIIEEYRGQLEIEQINDLKKKRDDLSSQIDNTLCTAYNIIIKYTASNGIKDLKLNSYQGTLNNYLENKIYSILKDSEWILEKVGINTLKKHNLFPSPGEPVNVFEIYEAFLRYDDKPMIKNSSAIKTCIESYCKIGDFVVAEGEKGNYNRFYYKESVLDIDIENDGKNYWILDKSEYKPPTKDKTANEITLDPFDKKSILDIQDLPQPPKESIKTYKRITISGKVDLLNYTDIFTSFIDPLRSNSVSIEIKITGTSNSKSQLTDESDSYRRIHEAAYQLGLNIEKEE